ncbi:S53 family peptidase [Spelaeicoccus albus]|uniref:Kumamolisin n=1 Tax=Spelaeicoccus albus TaxID=1280376 RepID=A0A7Z0D5N5_9MICO|nr:S53 family peptidase [Spelaeicoccus albus]NYI69359.1 kumamolisin [Spelaeicoccus albus]
MTTDQPRNQSSTQPFELSASHRQAAPDVRILGEVDKSERIGLTVLLRRKAELPDDVMAAGALTPAELAESYGASDADIGAVTAALTSAGLAVTAVDPGARTMRVEGPAGALATTFGVRLNRAESADPATGRPMTHRHREGTLSVPSGLRDVVTGVFGLDDRPQSRAHSWASAKPDASYTPLDLAKIYSMPDGDGAGQSIGIIELGGGFGDDDLTHYFSHLGIDKPKVTAVGVDGAKNNPGKDPKGADGEVLLDIEIAGAIAPKADIVVYFGPNTDDGFIDAVSKAVHADPTPAAISISWGQSEDAWTAQARGALDDAFADAAALGVCVTAAAGDHGSSDAADTGSADTGAAGPHVDFPASSPHALACGGTTLHADADTGTVTSETVWNVQGGGATGGGVSDVFDQPKWQADAGVPPRKGASTATSAEASTGKGGRGVPDVAATADPNTGYQVYVDGKSAVYGGTSAVAPLWAGLLTRIAANAAGSDGSAAGSPGKRPGLIHPVIYKGVTPGHTTDGFRDITSGSNGAYESGPGWDACTGLGVPDKFTLGGK